ncbi:hypothetical protein PVAND_000363 [Polypedilum vanderplanki]|uniref:RNA-directed DNA polymerase from transposon X-element n=1 Tax=Polypedilum vanderplanki TaxID=319348 RepID=A0A9J6BL29_POLVA|nr:hypothetical protein PVAND_000363 [Polypedilum vanderplanki]
MALIIKKLPVTKVVPSCGSKIKIPHGASQQKLDVFLSPSRFKKRVYDDLQDEDEGSSCSPSPLKVTKTFNKTNYQKISTEKFPPLIVFGQSISKIQEITNSIGSSNVQLKLVKEGIKVFVSTNSDFVKIQESFAKNSFHYYTHQLREEQLSKFVIHGLPKLETDIIKQALESAKLNPVTIKDLNIKKKNYDEHLFYLVSFYKKENITLIDLQDVKAINHIRISWQNFRHTRKGPTQCMNCLRFGHGTANCHLISRCIRCAGDHKSKECPLIQVPDGETLSKIATTKLKCALCGAWTKPPYQSAIPLARHPNAQQNSNVLYSHDELFKIFMDITTQLSGARTKQEQIQIMMSVAIKYAVPYNGRGDTNQVNSHFINDIRKLTNGRTSFFVCGDFNAKHQYWNCTRANNAGKLLYHELCQNNFFIEYPHEHTYIPSYSSNSPSTIDLIVTNKIHKINDLKTIDLTSDHRAVTFTIDASVELDFRPKTFLDFSKANWNKFQDLIHNNLDTSYQMTEKQHIDDYINQFTKTILDAQHKAVPHKTCSNYKLNLPDDLIEKIKIKNTMKRRWQRSRDVTLKAQVRFLERLIKVRVNLVRNENWSHKLSTIKPNHTNVWKLTKFLKKRDSNIPPIKTADGILNTPEEKANKLAEVFESNHLNPLERSSPDFTSLIKNKVSGLRQPLPANELPTFTDADEIFSIIQNLKNPKCPGADQISNRLIKKLPRRGIIHLVNILNACLQLNYFPNKWKFAKIIPIPKPGKVKSNPTSYRPISLLSSLSKILEKVILVRLQHHIEVNNIIPKEQFGFRSNSSTTHQLYKIINNAHEGLKFKKSTDD